MLGKLCSEGQWVKHDVLNKQPKILRGDSVVQSLSHIQLFEIPWTEAGQASLSFTISWSLLKLMSIESVMPPNHLILCHLLLLPSIFPSIRVFSNESALHIRWPKDWTFSFNIVLPVNIQSWFPLGWTGWISLPSKGLLRVPWTAKRSNQSILKKINPEYSQKDWCWSWSSNTLATWCEKLTH